MCVHIHCYVFLVCFVFCQIAVFVPARISVGTEQCVQKAAAFDETKSIACFDLGALAMLHRDGKKRDCNCNSRCKRASDQSDDWMQSGDTS